ncbi:hypothetical protein [Aureimonas altamirensis]|uniref:antitoxin VbhA family protein n=1 Tax=Aureimonas altamirensis TaxID=370622 RepID=UPI0025563B8A|nr:hypothetical protein [Aureimonas altamirensis]
MNVHSTRNLTTEEQRRKANNEARAANIRQGYKLDPAHEADMERWVRGEVSLDELRAQSIARHTPK